MLDMLILTETKWRQGVFTALKGSHASIKKDPLVAKKKEELPFNQEKHCSLQVGRG